MHRSFRGLSRVRPTAVCRANQYHTYLENSILSQRISTVQSTGSLRDINKPTLFRSVHPHSHHLHRHNTTSPSSLIFRRSFGAITTTNASQPSEDLPLDQSEIKGVVSPSAPFPNEISPKFYDPTLIPPEQIKAYREFYGEIRESKNADDRERLLSIYRPIANDPILLPQLQPIDFMIAMNSCRNLHGSIPMMLKILDDATKAGHDKIPEIYDIILKAYIKLSDFISCNNMVDKMVEKGINKNTTTYHIILDICKHQRKMKNAKGILETMKKNNVEVNGYTYLILLSICAHCRGARQAQEYFDEMPLVGVEQDITHYNALLNAYSRSKSLAGAQKVFELMMDEGIQPDMYTYSAMIRAYKDAKSTHGVEEMLNDMEKRELKPNAKVLTALGVDPVEVIEECIKNKVEVSNQDFNLLLTRALRSNKFSHVPHLLDYMQKAGHSPDVYTFTALIDADLKMGKYPEAKEVFKAMLKANVQPDVIAYSAMISGALTHSGVQESMELLKSMVNDGLLPNLHTFNSLLSASVGEIGIEGFKTIRYTMQQLRIRPDQRSFNALLSAYALQGDLKGMLGALADMKHSRVKPDALTYSILISGYLQNGDLRFAMEWYYKLIESGYAPATLVVNNLMAALHGSGQGQQIMLIWREMNNLGVKKNEQSFDIALEACSKFELHDARRQIEKELQDFLHDQAMKKKIKV